MTTISTAGLPALSSAETAFKTAIEAAIDGAVGNNSLTSAHIFVGNGSNVATDAVVSGVISLSNTGVVSFSTSFAYVTTTASNGEVAITGMTATGGCVVTPLESVAAPHVICGTDKITIYEAGTSNVYNAKSVAVLVLKKS